MTIYACQVCERKMPSNLKTSLNINASGLGTDFLSRVVLCAECATPLLAFLDRHGLLRPNEKLQRQRS